MKNLIPFLYIILFYVPSLAQNCPFTISVPQDITICEPTGISLNGNISGTYVGFEWNGSNGFTTKTNLNPTVFVNQTTTFNLSAFSLPTTNLIFNGDFESGNVGFSTDYLYKPDLPVFTQELWSEGTYSVISNPNLVHTFFSACNDHGPGSEMMVINGAGALQQVWCQTVAVVPNTNYIFQAFATSVDPSSPAILQFAIDGILLGNPFNLSSATCNWQEFYTTWNSGGSSSVEICITNQNTASGGNDFAIDDIFFGPVCEDDTEFKVTYGGFDLSSPIVPYIDCFNPYGILESVPVPEDLLNYGFEWNTLNGDIGSDPFQQNISITVPGLYTVTVTNQYGCTESQNFVVPGNLDAPVVKIAGQLSLNCYQPSTSLSASSIGQNVDFTWIYPDSTISMLDTISTSLAGKYYLSGMGPNGCLGIDSAIVLRDNSQVQYSVDSSGALTCNRLSTQVFVNLGTAVDSIVWTGNNIIFQNTDHDTITVGSAGVYSFVMHLGPDCIVEDSIFITKLPPSITYDLEVPDSLSCSRISSQLILKPDTDIASIDWMFQGQKIGSNDSLSIDTVGKYFVVLTDKNGCQKTDSLNVYGDYQKPTFSVAIDEIDCIDKLGQFIASSTEGISFLWQGNGMSSTVPNPTYSTSGEYTLTVTGQNGCQNSGSYYLPSSQDFPVILSSIKNVNCTNQTGEIDLSTNIPATFTWKDQDNNIGNSKIINSNTANSYTITAISATGCESTTMLSITVDTLRPNLADIAPGLLTCKDIIFVPEITASDYTSFVWTGNNINNNTVLEPTFSSSGNYLLTLNSNNGCIKSASLIVSKNISKPTFTATAPNINCISPQSAITLSGSNNLIYMISPSNQVIQNGHKISTSGTYTVTATNNLGCDSAITFTVNANLDLPVINPRAISLTCANPSMYVYDLNFDPSLEYSWETGGSQILSDSLSVSSDSKISLNAKNQYGCVSTKDVNILTDFEVPIFNILGDSVIKCDVPSTNVKCFSLVNDVQYAWILNGLEFSTKQDIDIVDPGAYSVNVLNPANGCTDTKSINISKQLKPTKIEYNLVQPLCYGEKGNFEWKNIISGTAPFNVSLDSELILKNKDKSLSSGLHQLIISDANGCILRDRIMVDELIDFAIDAGRDTTINISDEYQITSKADVDWSSLKEIIWTPSATLSCDDCPNPIALPTEDTEYQVTIINENNCIRTDKIWVRARFIKGYEVPTVFNPNSTLGNGKFTIYPLKNSLKAIKHFHIYDRWGNMVFETNDIPSGDPSYGWDGRFNAKELHPGVYIWVAQLIYKDESIENISGDITIIK